MISWRSEFFSACASISAKIGLRAPVAASITTTGCAGSAYLRMLSTGTMPLLLKAVWLSIPGMWTTIGWPGLKPSLRL